MPFVKPFRELLTETSLAGDLLEYAPDAIVIADTSGRIVYANRQVESLLGYVGAELVGESIEMLLPERFRDVHRMHRAAYVEAPSERPMGDGRELRARRRDGAEVIVEISLGPLQTSDGILISTTLRDASERHRLVGDLEAKNEELERFTYTVSHDLKAPLVTIKGFLGLLRRDLNKSKMDRVFDDIGRMERATEQMYHLLEQLLELSRIGRLQNPAAEVRLSDLVRNVLEVEEPRIQQRGVEIVRSDGDLLLYGDQARLQTAIKNLVENAIKYLGDNPAPRIEIGGREDGETTLVWVRDNGRGLAPENLEKVFELFTRLASDVTGTGLGLGIVRRVAELHGGKVWVESEGEGRGATFFLRLPSAARAYEESDA